MPISARLWAVVLLSLVAASCSSTIEPSATAESTTTAVPVVEGASEAQSGDDGAVAEEAPNPDELEFTGPIEGDEGTAECVSDETFPPARTDVNVDGNRLASGALNLSLIHISEPTRPY